jgi:hypothetical protein
VLNFEPMRLIPQAALHWYSGLSGTAPQEPLGHGTHQHARGRVDVVFELVTAQHGVAVLVLLVLAGAVRIVEPNRCRERDMKGRLLIHRDAPCIQTGPWYGALQCCDFA